MALSKEYFAQKLTENQKKWVGTTRTMQNGKKATIIAYRRAHDIDIQFEDGLIVAHKQLNDFVRGQIRHPIYSQKIDKKVGMIVNSKKWGKIECIDYKKDGDFDVLFHDCNNFVRKHCRGWKHFLAGSISPQHRNREPFAVGRTSVSIYTNQKMTVIEINPVTKWYKVQFEDGYITDWVKGGSGRFTTGHINNPNVHQSYMENKYIGKTVVANNGMKATSLRFSNPNDNLMIDVQFEDGVIVQVTTSNFLNGCIGHPIINSSTQIAKNKLKTMCRTNPKTGLSMKVIEYNTAHDITIQFETGYITQASSSQFYSGQVRHKFPYQIGTVDMLKSAYIYNSEGNFYCHCRKCGLSDVMSLAEIKAHHC